MSLQIMFDKLDEARGTPKGCRVGAILGTDHALPKVVKFFGYGTYKGNLDCPQLGMPNPCIELDNGGIVWGCECWWGPEEQIKAQLVKYQEDGYEIVNVNAKGVVETAN